MVKHVVIYKVISKSENTIDKMKEVLYSMKGRVPEVLDIEVGGDFLCSIRSCDLVLVVTLKDREALNSYQENDYHVNVVKKYMQSVVKESHSVDYEI